MAVNTCLTYLQKTESLCLVAHFLPFQFQLFQLFQFSDSHHGVLTDCKYMKYLIYI